MRVLVAGGSGVLGRAAVRALAAAGHEVVGTTRRADRLSLIHRAGGQGVLMDALVPESVAAAVSSSAPDAVVHELTDLAGTDFAANARLRVAGTANLVDAALSAGVRLVVAQSISWAYAPGDGPAGEAEPFARSAETGEPAFAAVEALERSVARAPHWVVLRYGLLYGPDTWYAPDGELTAQARAGRVVATTAWTSFVHVEDAAAATVRALDWPSGPVNIVDNEPAHVQEWGPLFARAAGFVGTAEISARTVGRAAANGRARTLGWRPNHPTWREAFAADGP